MFRTILQLFSINSYATVSSPFMSVDEDFIKREKKRIKIAKNALMLFSLLIVSIIITALGVMALFTFAGVPSSVIFAFFNILFGVSGIIYFSFLLEDATDDLQKLNK